MGKKAESEKPKNRVRIINYFFMKITKANLSTIRGGTSTTLYKEIGFVTENEYKDTNGNGRLDDDEAKQKPTVVDLPL